MTQIGGINSMTDMEIATAILHRDSHITIEYLYKQYYPLFYSLFTRYYTGCMTCKEFIDEIYILVLTPSKETGKCQLENFKNESSLATWFKSVCLFYCYKKFKLKERMPIVEPISTSESDNVDLIDRNNSKGGSIEIDFSNINYNDALALLNLMPNKRYSRLIRLRYLEQKTNEETAKALGMSMDNYYNNHKRAKEQYKTVLRKEAHNG